MQAGITFEPEIEDRPVCAPCEPQVRRRAVRLVARPAFALLLCSVLAGCLAVWRLYPQPLSVTVQTIGETPLVSQSGVQVVVPNRSLMATVAAWDDELFAYLMFNYLRHRPALQDTEMLLTYDPAAADGRYQLLVRAGSDLLTAVPRLISLEESGTVRPHTRELVEQKRLQALRRRTELFVSAYNLPVRRKLEQLPEQALHRYLSTFIRFKSATDPRILRRIEPVPSPLSQGLAQQLAGDILTIADFYSLPLDFFLGIGAMENNYMDVRGDLAHSVWKRRVAPGDIVLERRRGRVRVLNDSAGVWQITRETLRYAHQLIRRDSRDYGRLPEHLRPPANLDVNHVDPHVLTTYAGILLRDLLDRFNGDVTAAVSAYNGGPGRPNFAYGAGVQRAAEHARRVVEQAAVLNGESVVRMTWLRPR